MCLEQEHKPRSKNTNPKIKIQKLKISKSPFSQTQQYHQILKPHSIKSIQKYNTTNPNKKKKTQNQNNPSHLKRNPANPSHLKGNPANPPKANPDSVAMLLANELFSDGKLVPLQLSRRSNVREHIHLKIT